MKLETQRGESNFLVKHQDKYYLVDTLAGTKLPVAEPDTIYKGGYCEEPHPTKEQLEIIENIVKGD